MGKSYSGLMFFLSYELKEHLPRLRVNRDLARVAMDLHESSRCLISVYDCFLSSGVYIPEDEQMVIMNSYLSHLTLHRRAGNTLAPKHHQCFEMIRFIPRWGNPRFSSEYPDESHNLTIGRIFASVHPLTFSVSGMCKYRVWQMSNDRDL